MHSVTVMHTRDTVATALDDLVKGEQVTFVIGGNQVALRTREAIPFGHKLAIRTVEPGEYILKYGEIIGRATERILAGDHVHVHNTESLRGRGDLP